MGLRHTNDVGKMCLIYGITADPRIHCKLVLVSVLIS